MAIPKIDEAAANTNAAQLPWHVLMQYLQDLVVECWCGSCFECEFCPGAVHTANIRDACGISQLDVIRDCARNATNWLLHLQITIVYIPGMPVRNIVFVTPCLQKLEYMYRSGRCLREDQIFTLSGTAE